jgi:hypothetical protein
VETIGKRPLNSRLLEVAKQKRSNISHRRQDDVEASDLLGDQKDINGGRINFIKEGKSRDTALTWMNTAIQL